MIPPLAREISRNLFILLSQLPAQPHLFLDPPARLAEVIVPEDDLGGRPSVAEEVLLARRVAPVARGAARVAEGRREHRERGLQ